MSDTKTEAKAETETETKPGKWFIAIKPGTLKDGRFIKAGDVFQLGKDDVFTNTWMAEHEAPAAQQAAPSKEEFEEEQKKAVREHEETDRVRRGKFSFTEIPRSEESQKKLDEQREKEEQERAKAPPVRSAAPVAPAAPPAKR